jgi:predicted RNA-binding Zn-ribbon protein involved in translation (DUF1610 family)
MELRCVTCSVNLSTVKGSIRFKCPNCGEEDIYRCSKCRKSSKPWKCAKCGFEGP